MCIRDRYWYTTELLLNDWVGDTWIQLVVGFVIASAIYYLHDVFRRNAPTSRIKRIVYETVYDYVVKLSCICYHHGCICIYECLMATEFLEPIYVAVMAGVVLVYLSGYRNVLGLPILVEIDDSVERYHPRSTLTFHPSTQLMVGTF